jgi:hypothetical protein
MLTSQQKYDISTGAYVQAIPKAVCRGLAHAGAPKAAHLNGYRRLAGLLSETPVAALEAPNMGIAEDE